GSITADEIRAGQWWRALCATWIHGGLLHIIINLTGFYRLGQMVEEWYGSAQLIAIYVVIGVGGNLIAAAVRLLLSFYVGSAGGGGSAVLCGLMALVGTVGWRSRTKSGRFLLFQILGAFLSIGVLGLIAPIIDTLGHLGGAAAGLIVGLFHRRLVRNA